MADLSGETDHEACAVVAFERRGEGPAHQQMARSYS